MKQKYNKCINRIVKPLRALSTGYAGRYVLGPKPEGTVLEYRTEA